MHVSGPTPAHKPPLAGRPISARDAQKAQQEDVRNVIFCDHINLSPGAIVSTVISSSHLDYVDKGI